MEVGYATGANNITGQTTQTKSEQSILGKDDFLKLLIVQMQNQNPLEPMNDQEFMSQMAQFSSLEQLQNLAIQSETNQALSLVGAEVSVLKNGELITGVVDKVRFIDGKAILVIGDMGFTINEVIQVAIPTKNPEEPLEGE